MGSTIPRVQYFSQNGQGTGTVNMNVNGSVTPVAYSIAVPTGRQSFWVKRVLFYLAMSGSFDADKFANNLVLANGVTFSYEDGLNSHDLLGGLPIKQNGHFNRVMFDADVHAYGVGTAEFLPGRLTFTKFMDPVRGLDLENEETLLITISDDLTTVTEFTVVAEGQVF